MRYRVEYSNDARIEEAADIQILDDFHASDDGFRIPDALLRRELAGESPIKLWREHRGLTIACLANKAELAVEEVTQLEDGTLVASDSLLAKLARVMHVPEKVLIP